MLSCIIKEIQLNPQERGGKYHMKKEEKTIINFRDFPKDLYRKAKMQAVQMDISTKEFFIRAVTEYLKKQKGG